MISIDIAMVNRQNIYRVDQVCVLQITIYKHIFLWSPHKSSKQRGCYHPSQGHYSKV